MGRGNGLDRERLRTQMEERFERYHPDVEAMHHGFRTRPCFVCRMVGGGIRVSAERMYLFTFGSNESISHVHRHVVPLPPGVPYEDQQGAWTSWGRGVLRIPREEMASLAARIGARMG